MRRYIHRTIESESEIDPMNVSTRSVFFKKEIPENPLTEIKSVNKKSQHHNLKEIDSRLSEILPESLESFVISDKFDKKLISLKKQIENEIKMYEQIHKKLLEKTDSVEQGKAVLIERQKELSQMIDNKSQEFEKRNLEVIGELSSKMAHDIRNPLTVIKTQVDLMKIKYAKQEDEIMSVSLNRMDDAISRITDQINDVLEFIRNPKLELKKCDLKTLLLNAVNDISFPNTIQIESPTRSCSVTCDEIKIQTIFANIIHNAIQALDNEGKIRLRITANSDSCIVEIEDSGPVIPEEDFDKIFEPLFTTKHTGNGLGLASCRQILKLHGGSIRVKNNPTVFSIHIPRYPKTDL